MRTELIDKLREVGLLPFELDPETHVEYARHKQYMSALGLPTDSNELKMEFPKGTPEWVVESEERLHALVDALDPKNMFGKAYLLGTPQWVIDRDERIRDLATQLVHMEEGNSKYNLTETKLWEELEAYEDPGWAASAGYNDEPLSVADPSNARRSILDIIYSKLCTTCLDVDDLFEAMAGDGVIIKTETHYFPRFSVAQTGIGGIVRDPFNVHPGDVWVAGEIHNSPSYRQPAVTGTGFVCRDSFPDIDPSELHEAMRRAIREGGAEGVAFYPGAAAIYDERFAEKPIVGVDMVIDAPGPVDPSRFEGLPSRSLSKEDIRRAYIGKEGVPPATGSSETLRGPGPE